jgi:hypothetical protein
MVSREIWVKQALVRFSKTSNSTHPSVSCYSILMLFEKHNRSCFIQTALETILLPIPMRLFE